MRKYGRARQVTDDNIIRLMRIVCCVIKATITQSEYVLIIAFIRKEWSRERALRLLL